MEDGFNSYSRQRCETQGSAFAIVLTTVVNAAIVLGSSFDGLKYLYPPPQEKTVVIDFVEMEDAPRQESVAVQSEIVKEDVPAQMVQRGLERESVQQDAPEEEVIDSRALFRPVAETAPDSVRTVKTQESPGAGREDGNVSTASFEGMPSARLKGRTVVGLPVKPSYNVQNSGTVVVEIRVDRQGSVTQAIPGAAGTDVFDKDLWNAARIAALKTKFNVDPEAEGLQSGTITYVFTLE